MNYYKTPEDLYSLLEGETTLSESLEDCKKILDYAQEIRPIILKKKKEFHKILKGGYIEADHIELIQEEIKLLEEKPAPKTEYEIPEKPKKVGRQRILTYEEVEIIGDVYCQFVEDTLLDAEAYEKLGLMFGRSATNIRKYLLEFEDPEKKLEFYREKNKSKRLKRIKSKKKILKSKEKIDIRDEMKQKGIDYDPDFGLISVTPSGIKELKKNKKIQKYFKLSERVYISKEPESVAKVRYIKSNDFFLDAGLRFPEFRDLYKPVEEKPKDVSPEIIPEITEIEKPQILTITEKAELKPETELKGSLETEYLKKDEMEILEKIKDKVHSDKEETYSAPPITAKNYSGDITTLEEFSKAIVNRTGANEKETKKSAGFVLDLFGYDDCIIDNTLDPADRQLFYILEEVGILETGREEYKISGISEYANNKYKPPENWRTHTWKIKRDVIKEFAEDESPSRKRNLNEVEKNRIIFNPQKKVHTENIYENQELIEVWNHILNPKKEKTA